MSHLTGLNNNSVAPFALAIGGSAMNESKFASNQVNVTISQPKDIMVIQEESEPKPSGGHVEN